MKIRGIEVEKPIEIQTIIYECPYCPKKFIHKNSYYNHIAKNNCWGFKMDFIKMTNLYEQNKINKKQYYQWCYENNCIEFLNLDDVTKNELGEEFYNKICSLYDDWGE